MIELYISIYMYRYVPHIVLDNFWFPLTEIEACMSKCTDVCMTLIQYLRKINPFYSNTEHRLRGDTETSGSGLSLECDIKFPLFIVGTKYWSPNICVTSNISFPFPLKVEYLLEQTFMLLANVSTQST